MLFRHTRMTAGTCDHKAHSLTAFGLTALANGAPYVLIDITPTNHLFSLP